MFADLPLFEARPTPPHESPGYAAILEHSLWSQLRPFFAAEACGDAGRKQRFRIEIARLPIHLYDAALRLEVSCCACMAPIRPIRERRLPGNKRHDGVGHGLYYACACPLEVNVGCSRGKAAKANYAALVAVLGVA